MDSFPQGFETLHKVVLYKCNDDNDEDDDNDDYYYSYYLLLHYDQYDIFKTFSVNA